MISSRVLADREHDAVARAAQELRSRAGVRGRDSRDLVGDLVDGGEVEVGAEAERELGRDAPVVHRRPLGRDLAAEALHAAARGS